MDWLLARFTWEAAESLPHELQRARAVFAAGEADHPSPGILSVSLPNCVKRRLKFNRGVHENLFVSLAVRSAPILKKVDSSYFPTLL